MKNTKTILTILVAVLISVVTLSLPSNTKAATYETGTLVKTSDSPIIYFIASDGQRYAFPDDATFRSWYPGDNSAVKLISNAEMSKIPAGKAKITVRPGAKLAKFPNSPKVYVVKPGALLYWIKNERSAEYYYGNTWKQDIVNVDLSQFENYTFQTYVIDYSLDVDNTEFSKTRLVNSVYDADAELKNRKIITGEANFNLAAISSQNKMEDMPVLKLMTENLQANLQPAFNYTINKYTLAAKYTENTLNLKPVAANSQAVVYVNNTPIEHNSTIKLDLRTGSNKFEIKVKTLDGDSFTYYLDIARESANGNSYLGSITENLKSNTTPAFSQTVYEYEIYAEYEEPSVRLSAVAADKKSTVKITPSGAAPNYQQTEEILLDYGKNEITIEVRSESGNTKIYKITIIRRQYPRITNNQTSASSSVNSSSTTSGDCPFARNALSGTPKDPCLPYRQK